MSAINQKIRIIDLYKMGLDSDKIQNTLIRINKKRSIEYIERVINEYENEGTVTVNSRLKRI